MAQFLQSKPDEWEFVVLKGKKQVKLIKYRSLSLVRSFARKASSLEDISHSRMAPERFVRMVQIFGRLTLMWPPETGASRLEIRLTNFAWCIVAIINVCSISFAILQLVRTANDPVLLTRTLAIMVIICDTFLHLVLVRMQWPRFDILVHEVTNFLQHARAYERLACRKYVRRYMGHHVILVVLFFASIFTFIIATLVTEKDYPLEMVYPLSLDLRLICFLVKTVQYFLIVQTLCLPSGDFMIIMLLWYCTARLEMLGDAMRHVHDPVELRKCARKHENIISFVKEINRAIDLVILKSLIAVSVVILSAALQMSQHTKWTTLSRFFLIVCVASFRLHACAWAGDDLTEKASKIAWSIYQCPAIFRSPSLSRSAAIIIQTSKRTLVVTVLGRNLVLSLQFFAKYMIRVGSFFMTLRACVERYVEP